MADDWDKQLERLDERAAQRRAKVKELDEEAQKVIRESEQRRKTPNPADETEGPQE